MAAKKMTLPELTANLETMASQLDKMIEFLAERNLSMDRFSGSDAYAIGTAFKDFYSRTDEASMALEKANDLILALAGDCEMAG